MKKKLHLIVFLVVTLFLLSACSKVITETSTSSGEGSSDVSVDVGTGEGSSDVSVDVGTEEVMSSEIIVEITSDGFSPSSVTIVKGTTVTFINMDSSAHRPASNPHPAHTGYPEESDCAGSAFDPCENIAAGESWSFTFNEVGSWGYHDHPSSGMTGTITVTE